MDPGEVGGGGVGVVSLAPSLVLLQHSQNSLVLTSIPQQKIHLRARLCKSHGLVGAPTPDIPPSPTANTETKGTDNMAVVWPSLPTYMHLQFRAKK